MSDQVWERFDVLVDGPMYCPWADRDERRHFQPDLVLLQDLLAVPIAAGAPTQSGLPAKAVDVWVAAELRRAGFGDDEIWPRSTRPRVLPREVALVLNSLPRDLRLEVERRLRTGSAGGAVSADASILGKAYYKQVDVVISQWARGPELLISTKRMDSSLSNNALNRIEESYGDAHNLRGRYPLAAIGYVLVVRASAIAQSPATSERLLDLVQKLGNDPAGYDATCVIVTEWNDNRSGEDPNVRIFQDAVPDALSIGAFFETVIGAVLDRTPVDAHVHPRELRAGRGLFVTENERR